MNELLHKKLFRIIQGEVILNQTFREFYSVDSSSYKIIPKIIVITKK